MPSRALTPGSLPAHHNMTGLPERDPDYGEPEHLMKGEPAWLDDVVTSFSGFSQLLTPNGLLLRDKTWQGPNFYRDKVVLPSGGDNAFDQIFGAVTQLRFVTNRGKMGDDELEYEDWKIVNLDLAPAAIVMEALRRSKRANPESLKRGEFPDNGYPGTYLLALQNPDTKEYDIQGYFNYNEAENEIPVIARRKENGTDELLFEYPQDILDQERYIMQEDGITPSIIWRALALKLEVLAEKKDYQEILTIVKSFNGNASPNPEDIEIYKKYRALSLLPEEPEACDSYLWRAYGTHLMQELESTRSYRDQSHKEQLDNELVLYYLKSWAKLHLLKRAATTDRHPYRLVMILGSMDADHDPIMWRRHEAATDILKQAHGDYTVSQYDRTTLRRHLTGSFYVQTPLIKGGDQPQFTATMYPFGIHEMTPDNRKTGKKIEFDQDQPIPPIPTSVDIPHTPFTKVKDLLDEMKHGYGADEYPRLPGVLGKFTIDVSQTKRQQLVVLRCESTLGVFGHFVNKPSTFLHNDPQATLSGIVGQVDNSERSNMYGDVRRDSESMRGWDLFAVRQLGEWTAFKVVEGPEGKHFVPYRGVLGDYMPDGLALPAPNRNRPIRKPKRASRAVSLALVPIVSTELVPFEYSTTTGSFQPVETGEVAALVFVDPVTSTAGVRANSMKDAHAMIISPTGRRKLG